MSLLRPIWRCLCACTLLVAWCLPLVPSAFANEGGGAPASPRFNFVVNLGQSASKGTVLNVEVMFEGADPTVAGEVQAYAPKVQHEIILLLSDEHPDELRTLKGKQELAEKIATTVNKVIKAKPKDGVTEVLFTKFLLQ